MRASAQDKVVRSISGRVECRQVTQVEEWRIERAVDGDGFVLSIVSPGGESQSFLVRHTDAQDIGEVLRRGAVWTEARADQAILPTGRLTTVSVMAQGALSTRGYRQR